MEDSYLAQVEEFCVGALRKGLMLRPADIDLVRDWQARGVPLSVVKKGVLKGLRRFLESQEPTKPVPTTLKYYRTFVEQEFETWCRSCALHRTFEGMRVAHPSRDLVEKALAVLRQEAKNAKDKAIRGCYENAIAYLQDLAKKGVSAVEAIEQTEDFLAEAIVNALPEEGRKRVYERIKVRLEEASRRGLGALALEDLEREEIRCALAKETGFSGLIAHVLETGP